MTEPVSGAESVPSEPDDASRASALSWIGLWISVVASLGFWIFVVAASTGDISDNSDLAWPTPLNYLLFLSFAAFVLVIPAIVIDIIAGIRGGRSRVVAVLGGIILVSSALYIGLQFAVD